jgi:hypothetical protein
MIRIALAGTALTALMTITALLFWGTQAAFASGIFGAVALAIQLAALALLQPVKGAPFAKFLSRWGAGMGLRFLGIVAIALAAGLDRSHFPPLATALGFLGVLLPLLFYEVRLIR